VPRRPRLRLARWPCLLGVALIGLLSPSGAGAASLIATHDDAFVAHDAGSESWSIGSHDLELVLGLDIAGTLAPRRLFNPQTDRSLDITPEPDAALTAGGQPVLLSRTQGFRLAGVAAQETGSGVMIAFTFVHDTRHLRVVRSYASYPGSPVIETWTRVVSETIAPLSDMVGWQMTMPVATVRWLGGLRSSSVPGELEPFELTGRNLDPGEHFEIGATGRSSEQYIPFVAVDDGETAFFGGVMWSGAWRISGDRIGDRVRVRASFIDTPAAGPTRDIEVPHTFFGVATQPSTPASALQQFVLRGIRRGRPFTPLVTYNTWFAYGTTINEDALAGEIDRAAALGVELFVVDAGWYGGTGVNGDGDFESGLGSLTADQDRFPSGLASLADYTHNAGMKFGLWIEPERVALDLLSDLPGAQNRWLAARDGSYGSANVGQICLAIPEARQWVFNRVAALVEAVRPDYVKWDNNGWINCNRAGHGHGEGDGNFSHVEGLYDVLGQLRTHFPDLLIENVSGGGNRLDFGMLGLTDVAWMDDLSSPSTRVRHNLEGLAAALPPAYLLSFVIAGEGEELDTGHDLANIVRSRMPGVLGMTFRAAALEPAAIPLLAEEIQRYKTYRDVVATASAALLTAQAPSADPPWTVPWDVLQETSGDGRDAILFAFKGDAGDGRVVVRFRGLVADVTYDVLSADAGALGSASGESLMQDGIELMHRDSSLAHVLAVTARPDDR
jgi:alpha-galactosidase